MRILTANLREGLAGVEPLRALLLEHRIDVACFQELGPAQAEAIRELLPHGFLHPGEGARRFHGGGIAARSPLEVRRLTLPGRDAFTTELHLEAWPDLETAGVLEGPIELLSTHLLVPFGRHSWRIPLIRRRQVRGLLAYLDATPRRQRLLVGDLNSTSRMPAYRALASRLRDLPLEEARASQRRPRSTWAPSPRGPRLWRLDHALATGLEGARVEVVPIEGSDHAGLVVEVGAA
jgi:endonuclease/exonuclease/phosphatase family metal-dependent hydrolase